MVMALARDEERVGLACWPHTEEEFGIDDVCLDDHDLFVTTAWNLGFIHDIHDCMRCRS